MVNFTATSAESILPGWPTVDPPQNLPPPPRPYVFGTTAVDSGFRNDSMPSWGGNVVEGDDKQFHLFAAGFVESAVCASYEPETHVGESLC